MSQQKRFAQVIVLLSFLVVAPPSSLHAQASIALTGGKVAKLKDLAGTSKDLALIRFAHDPAITTPLANPLCPAGDAQLRLQDDDQTIVVNLPCANWSTSGTGYRYRDLTQSAAGVKIIKYEPGLLLIKAKGANYGVAALTGPTAFVEAELGFGSQVYCGRFESPPSQTKTNLADKVVYRLGSKACAPPTPTATATTTDTPLPTATSTPTRTVPVSCMDGIQGGLETDIDCGGPVCLPCATGKHCLAAVDCSSHSCVAGLCS